MGSIFSEMIFDTNQAVFSEMFRIGSEQRIGGGLLGGAFLYVLRENLGIAGALIVTLLITLLSLILITEQSLMALLRELFEESKIERIPEKSESEAAKKQPQKGRKEKKEIRKPDLHRKSKEPDEIVVPLVLEDEPTTDNVMQEIEEPSVSDLTDFPEMPEDDFSVEEAKPKRRTKKKKEEVQPEEQEIPPVVTELETPLAEKESEGNEYKFPPMDLLKKGGQASKANQKELQETATRLQQTLKNFGVNVTITNVTCGPSVTRYELQPEQGVKVSKIVNLTDDIKLNLAAADVRIEAPIPGKAAIGIEVPNRVNQMVLFRDLIDHPEFQKFPSKIGFAAGRDLYGKPVYADIEKMPHMLIAGATGSGKSVCINTIIMSILYKAHPKDVKMILIDPKVVELSVYNGIPHLLTDVVTDPKLAAGTLNWAVTEMMQRYNKFAEVHVRNIKSYNQKVENLAKEGLEGSDFQKLPQIVIVIDELADLMMVASREVEEAIVRLTQLARAAGIHLIIATQRPSVNVITGLIKANVPSRIAFAVTSGVDSRTIIDMNGAERLLGNGDMLFFPAGYKKPIRVQGGFVSDEEVAKVVGFLKEQTEENSEKLDMKVIEASAPSMSSDSNDPNGRDEYFYEAAAFIIDKDKASIASLQRVFKIGFNRASRLMEQLCDAGVVGEEEGTKPRKVIMSPEEFERMKEEEM
jgi:S-DNA-T family DNA segregation ATPase FtsK/SpoIIIE